MIPPSPLTIAGFLAWIESTKPDPKTVILFEVPESDGVLTAVDPPFIDFCAHDAQIVNAGANLQSVHCYVRCDCFQPVEELGHGVAFQAVILGPTVLKVALDLQRELFV